MHPSHGRWRAVVAVIAACMLLPTAVTSPAEAVAPPVRLRVVIGTTCVLADKPSGDLVKLTLRTAGGHYLGTEEDASSGTTFLACFTRRVRIGYRITIVDGDDSRTVAVPDLTIAGDRITDVASGHGPASKHITVKFAACSLSGCGGYAERDRIVDSHGRYHRDLSSIIDLKGADRLAASYTNSRGDTFDTQEEHVPYLLLSKPNKIHVECQPDRAVSVTLRTAGGTLRARKAFGKAGGCATPDGTFRKNGAGVNVAVGNIIRSDLASDSKVIWPHLAVSASDGGTTLSLRCLRNANFGVDVLRGGPVPLYGSYGTSGPDGHFSALMGFTFQSGDVLNLTCSTTKGDRITFTDTVP